MDARRLSASFGVVLVAAVAMSIAPASAATTTTRWVDGDGRAGPTGCGSSANAYKKIQSAVNASNAGDRVIVCPGIYAQQVRISGNRDGLTLESSTPFGATILTPASPTDSDGAVIMVAVDHVDDVTVQGFKILARTDGPCDDVDVAIAVIASRDAAIRGNRVLAPGTGGSGASCVMDVGIVVIDRLFGDPDPRSTSALVAFNEVRDAVVGGVIAEGFSRTVDMNIVHNSVRAYFGQASQSSSVTGVSGAGFGVGLLGRVRGQVRDNVIQGSSSAPLGGPGFQIGIVIGDLFAAAPAENGAIDVRDNIVRRVGYGLFLQGVDQTSVRRNRVTNTRFGIFLVETTDSAVRRNTIGAKSAGLVLGDSAGNDLVSNTVSGVGGSCLDDSSGSGTAGTDNHWADNTSTIGSSPAGICDPA